MHTAPSPVPRGTVPLGFPQALPEKPAPVVRPTPLPRRPKGRWFIGFFLLAAVAYAAYEAWDAFFRFQAYGTVSARVVQLSPPWDGVVKFLHVGEGDSVHAGQVLATLDNTDLRQRHAQIADELRLAQATLEAEAARLKWQLSLHLDQSRDVEDRSHAVARYYEAWGELLYEQSQLDKLSADQERAETMLRAHAASPQEVDQIRYNKRGQARKVEKLQTALAELKQHKQETEAYQARRANLAGSLTGTGQEQLRPNFARIEALQAERTRIEERLAQGELRASAGGTIVKIQRLPGERCPVTQPVLSLLVEGSLEIVMYLPQQASRSLAPGASVDLVFDPYPEPLTCTLVRLGEQFEPAPEHLKRYYNAGQRLLPAYFRPRDELGRWMALRPDGLVKLPWQFRPFAKGNAS
jgi:multidrug resistance efflux pump